MAAYFVVDVVEVTDSAVMEEYRRQVSATIARHGGRYLVRGGPFEVLEGDWTPGRVVVLEFPTLADARRWYDSEDYRGPKALRQRSARTRLVLVEGV